MSFVFATQLSDEPVKLGWINHEDFRFSLNMHCLFSDTIAIPVSGIVANPFWHPTNAEEQEAQRRLFSEGIIRPVISSSVGGAEHAIDVLLDHKEHLWDISADKMRRYATFIHQCTSNYAEYDDPNFRRMFYDQLAMVIEMLDTSDPEGVIGVGELRDLRSWHRSQADRRESFRNSEFWSAVTARFKQSQKATHLCVAGSAAYYNALSEQISGGVGDICSPKQFMPHLAALRNSTSSVESDYPLKLRNRSFEIELPLEAMAQFELADILDLRETRPFSEMRQLIERIPTESVEMAGPKLQAALNECHSTLLDSDNLGIRAVIRKLTLKRDKVVNRIQFTGETVDSLGEDVILALLSGKLTGSVCVGLFVFGCKFTSRLLRSRNVGAGGCSFRTTPDAALNVQDLSWTRSN